MKAAQELGKKGGQAKPEKLMLKVIRGGFAPADNYTTQKLRSRKYGMGEIIAATLTKPRNVKFWRMAHALGALVAENIESFAGMDSHLVIKRLQREALISCDEFAFFVPGCGMVIQYTPRSMSFESMSASEFDEVYAGICRHIIATYWPNETTARLEEMALLMESQ